jgi:tetratricopeptide (TPR) repeat protein
MKNDKRARPVQGGEDSLLELIEHERNLAQGQARVLIETEKETAASAMINFLRCYRGRNDLAQTIPIETPNEFSTQLEAMKSVIFAGKFQEALEMALQMSPRSEAEHAELELERARLSIFLKKPGEAIQWARVALARKALCPLSRVTAHSVAGHGLILEGRFEEAKQDFQAAIALGECFPNAESSTSSLAFLVWAHSELKEWESARAILSELRQLVDEIESEELWISRLLVVIRGEAHFYRCLGDMENYRQALEDAVVIGRWIGVYDTAERSEAELKLLGGSSGNSKIHRFENGCLLAHRGMTLIHAPKRVNRIDGHPVVQVLILALAEGPKTSEELFKIVWNLNYDPERHANHLRSYLSKARKLLPKGALRSLGDVIILR